MGGALIALSLLLFFPQVVAAQETATGIVNGSDVQLAEGVILATGTPVGEGDELRCDFPEVTFGARNGPDVVRSTIVANITDNCEFVIASVDREYGGSISVASTRYRGGAWTDLYDLIHSLLMESYADMYYYDDGGSVWGGHQPYTYCYNKPWWIPHWSEWNWLPNGPGSVSIWKLCDASAAGYEVTLDATFYGWPGGAWDHFCDIYGSIPAGYTTCSGDHFPA